MPRVAGKAPGATREAVLRFMAEFQMSHRHPPTVRQVAEEADLVPSAALYHMQTLERSGDLVRCPCGCKALWSASADDTADGMAGHLRRRGASYEETDVNPLLEPCRPGVGNTCRSHSAVGSKDTCSAWPRADLHCLGWQERASRFFANVPTDAMFCGRCGDWLQVGEIEGHLHSEGRFLPREPKQVGPDQPLIDVRGAVGY